MRYLLFASLLLLVIGCSPESQGPAGGRAAVAPAATVPGSAAPAGSTPRPPGAVDGDRLAAAAADAANWLTHGRTYAEQRFSPLGRITDANVDRLGLAWSYDLPVSRGIEATPLIVDGIMYTTAAWSLVYAFDAASGELKWVYDPQVPRDRAYFACCDVVNRGVAVWQGKVYVGTLDGRLVALDADSGAPVWETRTTDPGKPYTITGAPRVIKGKVMIGNGGAEYGVRGYLSAYDAASGKLAWRFYTVPGDPAVGFEDPAQAMAAATWSGEWWKVGGGGTVWDAMAYDPELDLLIIGVGNGSPWNQALRSPGGGDNLFLSSLVALRPDTGAYVWHYQTTPGETWDYTATQHIVLADLEIDGTVRKVAMQAPKNGFFYVVDRATGEFISAMNYVELTWATHVDTTTGRPVEAAGARDFSGARLVYPGALGGHNWHPMAFHPGLGLVYIPAQDIPFAYEHDDGFHYDPLTMNTGFDFAAVASPDDDAEQKAFLAQGGIKGRLLAWDPVAQKKAWAVEHGGAWNGGVLATGGNLVFQGHHGGAFRAYRADTGKQLWSFDAQTGVVAGPVSYAVDGEQYIAVMAGWGGAFALVAGRAAEVAGVKNVSRVLVFKLGGDAVLPAASAYAKGVPRPPPMTASAAVVARGKEVYSSQCFLCHGDTAIGGGVVPDLRFATLDDPVRWREVVLNGALSGNGMVAFEARISADDAEAIRHYVIKRAHDRIAEMAAR